MNLRTNGWQQFVLSLLLVFSTPGIASFAVPFTAGNLAIYRVGTGSGSLVNTGSAVFVDEYSPTGALVQSIALPTSGAVSLIASGTATSEGLLNLSPDGTTLALTGYSASIPTAGLAGTASATVNRTVALINAAGTASLYGFSDYADTNNPRSAIVDGNNLYMDGGAGGMRYRDVSTLTPNTSGNASTQLNTTAPTNLRAADIFGGQLYASANSTTFRLTTVGAGEPTTSGQTLTNLPGFPTSALSPYQFFMADLNATIAGVDTLYVADDTSGAVGGIKKYSLVGGSWTANGTLGAGADGYRGLTASVNGGTVTLYSTRKGGSGASGGGELVSIVDSTGYNASIAGSINLLATAAANTAFRGLDFVPVAVPEASAVAFGGLACCVSGLAYSVRRRWTRRSPAT